MEKVYVFGHMNPDTDSVCAAINLANLKRCLGIRAEERVLGPISKETKFVLDYFKVKEPRYLNDTKLRIKDIKYRNNCILSEYTSIKDVYDFMLKVNTTAVSIVNDSGHLINLITAKDILRRILYPESDYLKTSYSNILSTLCAEEIVHVDDEICSLQEDLQESRQEAEKAQKQVDKYQKRMNELAPIVKNIESVKDIMRIVVRVNVDKENMKEIDALTDFFMDDMK